jgi:predicted amidohydrolase
MSIFKDRVLSVSVIQMVIKQGEVADNWERAEALLDRSAADRPALVVLPEAFATGVNFIILRQMAEPIPDGPNFRRLARLAADYRIHLCAGLLELGDDGAIYDVAVLVDPEGALTAHYRRRFLWVGERSYVRPGAEPLTVTTSIGRVALIVGYDLCFPEACGSALNEEVDLIACPASVFRPLSYSTERLAAARAMDHHCYFLYANALGFHQFANMHYGGRSGIFGDPYFLQIQLDVLSDDDPGRIASCGDEEGVISGKLRLGDLARAQAGKLPFRGDARFTLDPESRRQRGQAFAR